MEIGKYVKFEDGKMIIDIGMMAMPMFEQVKAKIMSGEIDPVKGTDFDKEIMMKALDAIMKVL